MDSEQSGSEPVAAEFLAQLERGSELLPGLLAAGIVLFLGWLAARLARSAVERLAMASNGLLARAFPRGALAGARISSGTARLLGELVFWLIALISLTLAARLAGLPVITAWLERITAHLPSLIAGAGIFAAGYFLSIYVREQLAPSAATAISPQQLLLGRVAQAAVIAVGLIIGLAQIGIEVAVLIGLTVSLATTLGIGLAIAFALGARQHISNLIGARVAQRELSVGLRVRIADVEGEVLEVTPTQIALDTESGKALVPASCLDKDVVTIVTPDPGARVDDG